MHSQTKEIRDAAWMATGVYDDVRNGYYQDRNR